ncbi:MAG: hypothetical protein GF421_02070 [Candidatus Aminicenantes bacterium]|nr:hypothetical protein [Candidatus Aminicenantes bacterium]
MDSMKTEDKNIPFVKKWITAARPWALPASTMPVIFGTSLAIVIGGASFQFFRFVLALCAMVILHSAANILSDFFDFRRGIDRNVTPVSGAVVRGWISKEEAAVGSGILFVLGSALGLVLVFMTNEILLVIGVIGVAVGVIYSFLKYHAWGDFAVFLDFGILGSLGAWVVQTKEFSWIPVIWTVPMAMLVSAILHANNWRDMKSDTPKGVRTVASLLGDQGSLYYYYFLTIGPFVVLLCLILGPRIADLGIRAMPFSFFMAFLSIPSAGSLLKRALSRHKPSSPMDFIVLDGATSKHNLVFGILCTGAVWLHFFIVSI